jgi:hypothetical protein
LNTDRSSNSSSNSVVDKVFKEVYTLKSDAIMNSIQQHYRHNSYEED